MLIDPKSPEMRRRRFRPIPIRMLVPNFITLLAICAGLTAIRLSTEGRMELAVAAIVFAAVLDGIDGRVARMIKGQSKFGAELDSLADFVNFGVAPGLILYFWQLRELHNGGWIAAMVFAISGGLRLARFNASIDDPNKPAFAANFFTGVPARRSPSHCRSWACHSVPAPRAERPAMARSWNSSRAFPQFRKPCFSDSHIADRRAIGKTVLSGQTSPSVGNRA